MPAISISELDLDALARTARSEVGHFGKYGDDQLEGGVEAVVDTIINRSIHPSYPGTIQDVVDQKAQFSAIGGPGGTKTWSKLPAAGDRITRIVSLHVTGRANGKASTVRGATHFLNPHHSSPSALKAWGNHVVKNAIAVWGSPAKKDVHYHGFAPGVAPPPHYSLRHGDASTDFDGNGVPIGGEAIVSAPTAMPAVEPVVAAAYRVERVTAEHMGELQDILNGLAEEGWRLRQILAENTAALLVMEKTSLSDADTEVDETIMPGVVDSLSAAVAGGAATEAVMKLVAPGAEGFDMAAFTALIKGLALKFFEPHEFLVLGNQHFSGTCKGKNTLPPAELWPNILPTARILDRLREKLGSPIRTLSVYRSPAYNGCIPGAAGGSVHKKFKAVDFSCEDGMGSVHWARTLKELRDSGAFRGGIGVYPTFVHVDTRGANANFGPWMDKVF